MKPYILGFILFFVNSAFAHLCHDPFRPREHLVLVPEKESISIEETGEFRMYIENTFSSPLMDVRLRVGSPAFDIEVEPPILPRLAPSERSFFLIKLRLKEGFKPGDYPLDIGVEAKRAELKPGIDRIDVTVKKERKEPDVNREIRPEERMEEIETPQKKIEVETKPQPVRKVIPQEEAPKSEEVIPEEVIVEEEVAPQEQRKEETERMVVKVEEAPFWKKPHFYFILILLFLGILMWRKRR